jgi:hypothetical protein
MKRVFTRIIIRRGIMLLMGMCFLGIVGRGGKSARG